MTAPRPRLPDFLIVGAFKSGTTSLVDYLGQHPDVWLPWLQEPAFFASPRFSLDLSGDPRPQKAPESAYGRPRTETLAQYAALFADAPVGATLGESSPQYLREPEAPARIASLLPDVKLLAVLRHPAQRAYSDYMMFVRDGMEKASFAEVVARPYGPRPPQHFVETGFYGKQLQRFYDIFPRDQIRVVLTEDLAAEPAATLGGIFSWLGVDPDFRPDVSGVRNVSGMPANRAVAAAYALRRRAQPVLKPLLPAALVRRVDDRLRRGLHKQAPDPQVIEHLSEVYRDDIALLSRLLQRDLSAWS